MSLEFNPSEFEPKWQKYWEENQSFKTDESGTKKLFVLDMFPYPSGAGLHIGHPLGYTATDIYCRFKRACGFSVLHPMGYDAFGLPAEQHAVSTGVHPKNITENNCQRFTEQMKRVGLSYDWSREIATCNPDYYKWTQWIFLKIYNSYFDCKLQKARPISELPIPDSVRTQGDTAVELYKDDHRLAYHTNAMVNWCPALGTVLANEEVIDGKSERGGHDVIRKPMKQWMLRITSYAERLLSELEDINWPDPIKEQQRNWIGKKYGAEIKFPIEGTTQYISAFTTRPDTLFGVTFFVVSPEHPAVDLLTVNERKEKVLKYKEDAAKLSEFARTLDNRKKTGVFTGGFVINPITEEKVPVYVGDYVLMSYGTGAVMGVPAHDERDFEFARTFQIDIRPVIVPKDAEDPIKESVIDGEISWTGEGIMLSSEFKVARELALEGISNKLASEKIVSWLSSHDLGKSVVNYKLRDWLFSRQRYWGEPIPVIHWEDGTKSALSENELPLLLPEVKDYKPSDGGESPLAKATDWVNVVDSKTGRKGKRETDTMPQWAGSCWYYLRFIDPHNTEAPWAPALEKKWMPVDLYVGGAEHAVLHLLYARFWHRVLFDLGFVSTREPFMRLFNQGMILSYAYKDSRGALVPVDEVTEQEDGEAIHNKTGESLEKIVAKMSKSLRNVINPEDVIYQYGADTLRLYLMFMGPLDASRVWDSKAIMGCHRFLKRAWAFVVEHVKEGFCSSESVVAKRAIHKLVKRVTEDTEELRFNTAIAASMEFLNDIGNQKLSKESLEKFVICLSAYAPHTGEELWKNLGNQQSVSKATWPKFDEGILKEDSVTVVVQVSGKKRATFEVSPNISEELLKKKVIQSLESTSFSLNGNEKFIVVYQPGTKIPKLINVVK